MKKPIVSVIIATYRREKRLRFALESLRKQRCSFFEIIVVDDNDDRKWNKKVQLIVDDFKRKSEIEIYLLVNHPNKGSAEARNCGIRIARGDYITFLDDDDIYLPYKILYQYEKMKKQNADYSISNLLLYSEKGKLVEKRNRHYLLGDEAKNLLVCHMKYHMTAPDTMMFKREYLLKIGMFEPINVGDDYYLMMKAINSGGKFVYINRSDVKAIVHTQEAGLSNGQSKIEGEKALFEFKRNFFSLLSRSDRHFVEMRHHAVLAFAYLRMNKIALFIFESLGAFLQDPKGFLNLLINFK